MDSSAITLARDNNIPMVVFSILEESSFVKAILAEEPHTIISERWDGSIYIKQLWKENARSYR